MTRALWSSLAALVLGGCICGPGETLCDGRCVDLESDLGSCGACGYACSTSCVEGSCLPGTECSVDAECDDGLACNGRERCVPTYEIRGEILSTCAAGTPVACDDGVMCTRDRCVEPSGACDAVPDDTLCSGGTCDRTGVSGCSFPCERSPCGVVEPQCGCADTDGCYPSPSGIACAPAGVLDDGATCVSANDCRPGFGCIDVSLDPSRRDARCVQLCSAGADCPSGVCPAGPFPGTSERFGRCASPCVPNDDRSCPRGWTCAVYHDPEIALTWTECASNPGLATQGMPCETTADCATEHVCLTTSVGLRCTRWCRSPSDCSSPSLDCVPLSPEIVIGGVSYGACL